MQLGYTFKPLPISGHPGSRELEVIITEEPTLRHFDPDSVRATIITEDGFLATLITRHPWIGPPHYQYSAGLIRIGDRKNEVVDAYSMGGQLTITASGLKTSLNFISTAPIFPKLVPEQESFIIATQLEALLAERRAIWAFDPSKFEKRLSRLNPEDLYWLCVQELHQRYANREIHEHSIEVLSSFLLTEIQRLVLPRQIPLIVGSISEYL
jgi:hypothetical protein